MRWNRPGIGIVPPDRFIPQFEKNGFIFFADRYIREQVCRQIRIWLDAGIHVPRISVNILRRDLMHSDLPVIAEGVENKMQADFPKNIGCYYMQGYLFSKPVPADAPEKLLRESKTVNTDARFVPGVDNAASFLDGSM